jgi:O-antigen/teichoic acid export membrane protein
MKALHWFDFSTFLKFAGGNLVFQIITILCELYLLKLVDVHHIGLWQYALLLQSYVIISRLGIINAFNREYPYLSSLGETEKSQSILQTTAFHVMLSMAVQALFFLALGSYYLLFSNDYYLGFTMMVMVAYTSLDAFANFEEAKLRGVFQFNKISSIKVIVSIVSILSLAFPYNYGFEGLLIRAILIQLFLVILFKAVSKVRTKPVFTRQRWIQLFNDGWKFWIWSYLRSFNKSLPKLFLVVFSSLTIVGLYTPINWLLLVFTLFTSSLSTYLYPTLSHRFAKGDKNLPKQSLAINSLAFVLAIPLALVGYFLLPTVIKSYLPQYEAAIVPMQIALFASLFDIITVSATVWASLKDWSSMYKSTIFSLLINIASLVWLYFNQADLLVNVSLSILFSSVFSALLIVYMIFRKDAKAKAKAAILPV